MTRELTPELSDLDDDAEAVTDESPRHQPSDDATAPSAEPQSQESGAKIFRRVLLTAGLLAIVATAAAFLPGAFAAKQNDGPKLTHTIQRGDLLVTVTEQGTLESSNNTEVKCKVRGFSTVTYVVPAGAIVETGDVLVRLDTKIIEEQYSLTKTNTFIATATLEESKAAVAKAKISLDAYKEGGYLLQMQELEKELEAKRRNFRTAKAMLGKSQKLFRQGYVSQLEVEGNAFTSTRAELELQVQETQIKVLREFTQKMELETLQGNLTASKSKLAADEAGLAMEKKRRDRAKEELEDCVIKAEKAGLVIYPSAAAWKRTPDITEGATVRKDQVLLLMPDLTKMQIKVGIHESIIDRVRSELPARVTLPDRTLEAKVSEVASVTRPAGWWTGNVVKYDTIIELPEDVGLKPGMSAEVEIILAVHKDVIKAPVAAVIDTEEGDYCWVKAGEEFERRILQLGDSNDIFVEVKAGLKEGDQVVLNPSAFIDEAENEALGAPKTAKVGEDENEVEDKSENEKGTDARQDASVLKSSKTS